MRALRADADDLRGNGFVKIGGDSGEPELFFPIGEFGGQELAEEGTADLGISGLVGYFESFNQRKEAGFVFVLLEGGRGSRIVEGEVGVQFEGVNLNIRILLCKMRRIKILERGNVGGSVMEEIDMWRG